MISIYYFSKYPLVKSVNKNVEQTNNAINIINTNLINFHPQLVKELQYVDVLYEDMDGSKEGYILKSQINKSGKNSLYLNSHFQNDPPIFAAMVIAHETTHILQLKDSKEMDCVDMEVAAFLTQAYLYFLISDQDRITINQAALKYNDPTSKSILKMAEIFDTSLKSCGKENWVCWSNGLREKIKEMVISSETYQKQCQIK